jgi:hypothetical protein
VRPLTKHGQEQNEEKIFHGNFLVGVGVKGLVAGGIPAGLLVLTTGAPVDAAGLAAGVVLGGGEAAGLAAGVVLGADAGGLAVDVVRTGAFF